MVVRIVGDNSDFDKSVDTAEKKFVALGKSFVKVGKALTTFVTLPLVGLGIAAVKSAANIEMQQAAFETMLGSAQDAKKMLTDLKDLAAKTPFQLTDLANASKTLLSFGFDAERVLPTIRQLGDVAGGNSDRFSALSLAFAQVQATGRLMGQDLLQMINAGFNPLQQIAEDTGQSMAELKAAMEDGAISADMVAEAFAGATEEGGRFFGGMERASKTLEGQWSTLMDTLAELGRSFADILLPTIKIVITNLTWFAERFSNLDEGTKRFILTVAGLTAAIGPLLLGIGKLIPAIHALGSAIKAHPYLAAAGAVIALGVAIAGYIKGAQGAKRATDELIASLNSVDPITRKAQDASFELRFLITDLKDATVGSREMTTVEKALSTAIADLAKKYGINRQAVEEAVKAQHYLNEEFETQPGVYKTLGEMLGFATRAQLAEAAAAEKAAKEREERRKIEERYKQALSDISAEFDKIAKQEQAATATGQEYNAVEEKRKAVLEQINKLIDEGWRVEKAAGESGITYIQAILDANKELFVQEKAGQRIVRQGSEDERKYTEAAIYAATEELDVKAALWAAEEEAAAQRKAEHEAELARIKAERDERISAAQQIAIALSGFARSLADRKLEELRRFADAQEQAYAAELERDAAGVKTQLTSLDTELQAALVAAGVAEKTEEEQLRAQIEAAKTAGDTEKQTELEAALKREQITADFALRRQAIIDAAEEVKVAKQKAYDEEIAANHL